jgi:hypothetical protein
LDANGQLLDADAATNGVSGLNGLVHNGAKTERGGGGGKAEGEGATVPPLNLAGLHRYPDPYVGALIFCFFYRAFAHGASTSGFFSFLFFFFLLLKSAFFPPFTSL